MHLVFRALCEIDQKSSKAVTSVVERQAQQRQRSLGSEGMLLQQLTGQQLTGHAPGGPLITLLFS